MREVDSAAKAPDEISPEINRGISTQLPIPTDTCCLSAAAELLAGGGAKLLLRMPPAGNKLPWRSISSAPVLKPPVGKGRPTPVAPPVSELVVANEKELDGTGSS